MMRKRVLDLNLFNCTLINIHLRILTFLRACTILVSERERTSGEFDLQSELQIFFLVCTFQKVNKRISRISQSEI